MQALKLSKLPHPPTNRGRASECQPDSAPASALACGRSGPNCRQRPRTWAWNLREHRFQQPRRPEARARSPLLRKTSPDGAESHRKVPIIRTGRQFRSTANWQKYSVLAEMTAPSQVALSNQVDLSKPKSRGERFFAAGADQGSHGCDFQPETATQDCHARLPPETLRVAP